MSSEHDVRVVEIGAVDKHPNADTLSITYIDGRPVVFRTGDYRTGDTAVYIPVDSILPDTAEWSWLKDRRIRAMKLRGIFSMGLLAQAPAGSTPGDDVRDSMGISVYNPEVHDPVSTGGDNERDLGYMPVYTDIESLRKYRSVFERLDCYVVATEKVHGANARYTFRDGRLWCGSRTGVKAWDHKSIWWRAADQLGLEAKLSAFPGMVLYGEVYGQVQNLKYGVPGVEFVAFDAYVHGVGYMDYNRFSDITDGLCIPRAPTLFIGAFPALSDALAEGPTIVGDGVHYREGFVVRPLNERYDDRLGRVIAKLVGQEYLLGKKGKKA